MKITHKFVLKAYIGPMILTFFIVMFILLMHFLWLRINDLVGKGLSAGVIAELVMYAAATVIPMALPLATLLASIMTLGNLGENYELLALKSAGISLPNIMKPLIFLMVIVCTGSFFVINNLTPYSWQQMFALLSDISRQRQEMKFQNGIFFNGIPDMSIRVEHQDPETNKLTNILIYNTQKYDKMQTTVADSGYIKISDDRKFLIVNLFNGQIYEETRNYNWFNNNELSHHIFDKQEMLVPLSGFAFERSDDDEFTTRSETKSMAQLTYDIDSLMYTKDSIVERFTELFLDRHLFRAYSSIKSYDSIPEKPGVFIAQNIDTMSISSRSNVLATATKWATEAQTFSNYEVEFARYPASLMYRAQLEYQKKISLPFSIMIFFLIGAPLGAIIRKGGLGMPIVVSVAFFVIYYIISITAEKFVKDGAMNPFVGVWMSSFVLLPLAIFLTYKSTNDSALLNIDVYKLKLQKLKAFTKNIFKRKK